MTFEERAAHYKRLSHAAQREMDSWESSARAERREADGRFRSSWQEKKDYDEAQSSARRNIGDMNIGERFW
jgi:hypothetical protein